MQWGNNLLCLCSKNLYKMFLHLETQVLCNSLISFTATKYFKKYIKRKETAPAYKRHNLPTINPWYTMAQNATNINYLKQELCKTMVDVVLSSFLFFFSTLHCKLKHMSPFRQNESLWLLQICFWSGNWTLKLKTLVFFCLQRP